uniref:Mitochondrial proton/calcium exchanger protein n=1 Tax=Cacopsylla melanoneura TaxID=428564 RepID=A0A8D9AR18_9HEMI
MYPLSKVNKSIFLRNPAFVRYHTCCLHCHPVLRPSLSLHNSSTSSRSLASHQRRPVYYSRPSSPSLTTSIGQLHTQILSKLEPADTLGIRQSIRHIHVTSRLRYDEPLKPSSKIEETVQNLKEKAKEKEKQTATAASVAATTASDKTAQRSAASTAATSVESHPVPVTPASVEPVKPAEVVVKKTIGQKIWTEVLHYYHGFRLLGLDIKLSAILVWRILNGKKLTRREHNLLVRTTGDIFRLIPFSVFIIVPFMELLLPVFIKFFPGMLPSQFATTKEKEDKMKQSLKVKLEMAKFLQKTLDNMGVAGKGRSSESAKEFQEFYEKVRSKGVDTSTADIMKFSRLFQDEITLDSLTREQLQALCRVLELHPIGTSNFLRFQMRLKLRSLAADDKQIEREGVGLLTLEELQNACRARGMRAYGVPKERLQTQLKQWLDLSLNEKVPPSLLLLSRAFMLPETTPTTEILKQAISELPETVAVSAKAAIDEIEGSVDNKTKLLVLKEEERKIKEEKEEYLEEKKRMEVMKPVLMRRSIAKNFRFSTSRKLAESLIRHKMKQKAKKLKDQEIVDKKLELDSEQLLDKAEVLIDKATILEPQVMTSVTEELVKLVKEKEAAEAVRKPDEDMVASADLQVVEDALEAFGKDKKELLVEKHELADLKEEMGDYQEDLKDLEEVLQSLDKDSKEAQMLKESKAAKRLFKRVNKMITSMDTVIEDLNKKEKAIKEDMSVAKEKPEVDSTEMSAELVKIDELIGQLRKIQQVPDTSKLQRISQVLDTMDADHDGAIRVEAVLKVLELIGEENVNLSKKQFQEIIEMINKEEAIELEEQMDKVLKAKLKESTSIKPLGEHTIEEITPSSIPPPVQTPSKTSSTPTKPN